MYYSDDDDGIAKQQKLIKQKVSYVKYGSSITLKCQSNLVEWVFNNETLPYVSPENNSALTISSNNTSNAGTYYCYVRNWVYAYYYDSTDVIIEGECDEYIFRLLAFLCFHVL